MSQFLRKQVLKKLSLINQGCIEWQDQEVVILGDQASSQKVKVVIKDRKFYRRFALRGSLGVAESYILGEWQCGDVVTLLKIVIENQHLLKKVDRGLALFTNLFGRLKTAWLRNNVKRSRLNILKHYDLSNDFFFLFLDEDYKQYSSALYLDHEMLQGAQYNKLKRICDSLQLMPEDHLLEIGTGWGGLAIFAAQNYGCHVTTTTVSDQQYQYVQAKISQLGLGEKITLLKKDYRDLTGQYDKLVSIEMIEAVGHQYFNNYFKVCDRLLKPGGLFCLQAITILDQEYERYKSEIDFIRAYIFPGGCLPSLTVIANCLTSKAQSVIRDVKDMGPSYAKTLAAWHATMLEKKEQVLALGFDEQFIRTFQFYFDYCQAGFESGYISVSQILIEKR